MAAVTVESEEHWHQLRSRHVGGSEIAALFGVSAWCTPWQLWMIKAGRLDPPPENAAMLAGRFFEPAVAEYAEHEFGVKLRKVRRYLICDDCEGLGASLDYEEYGGGSLIPTEIKYIRFGSADWEWDGAEITDAPIGYQLQVQTQLACSGSAADLGQLIAFLSDQPRRFLIRRDESLIAEIRRRVTEFWKSIREGVEPEPDWTADAAGVMQLFREADAAAERVDLSHDNRATALAGDIISLVRQKKTVKTQLAAAIAELTVKLGKAPKGIAGDYRISAPEIADTPPKEIQLADVGTMSGGRKGYRRVTVTLPKKKEAA